MTNQYKANGWESLASIFEAMSQLVIGETYNIWLYST